MCGSVECAGKLSETDPDILTELCLQSKMMDVLSKYKETNTEYLRLDLLELQAWIPAVLLQKLSYPEVKIEISNSVKSNYSLQETELSKRRDI